MRNLTEKYCNSTNFTFSLTTIASFVISFLIVVSNTQLIAVILKTPELRKQVTK